MNRSLERPLSLLFHPNPHNADIAMVATHTITPIKNVMKKRALRDISIGLGAGIGISMAWWTFVRNPEVEHRKAFYRKLEAEKNAQA